MAAIAKGVPAHIKAEAAAWLARLHSDERSAGDEAGFRLWLISDPRNRDAFGEITTSWDDAGGAAAASVPASSSWTRRRMMSAGAATVLAAAGAGLWVYAVPDTYETMRGEQRRIALTDGSILLLDTDSAVRVSLSSDRRVAQIDRGRAHFQVASDPLRRFLVKTEGYELDANGASFDVDASGDRLAVLVIEGRIGAREETRPGRGARMISAPARMQVVGDQPARIDSPMLAPLIAWHDGMLIFMSQPLRSAAAQMDRYSRRAIIIADEKLALAPVSGRFDAGDSVTFAKTVAQQLSVPLRVTPGEIVIGRA